jgi:DNA polymerase V
MTLIQSIMTNIKKIGIVDCNNFYVSCERVFNPISIGRPTVVLSNNDGCVIARSQEAKDLGIKMGEPFFLKKDFMEEHRFCVYSSNYNLYGDMSDRVMTIIKKYANDVEVYSIDECFVDFSNIPDDELTDRLLLIKNEVKRLVGIPVSIGVGPNKTLAKLTSYIAKKQTSYNGVCSYWTLQNFRDLLYTISADEVWGIGRKWYKKLKMIGVDSVGQFVMLNDGLVRKMMTVNGLKTKMELLGMYCHPIQPVPKLKRNIASTRSFGKDIDTFDQIAEAMYSYVKNGVKKLHENGISPNRATIFIAGNKHKDEKHYSSKQILFQRQTRDENEIWSQIYPHLKKMFKTGKKYKKCGIIFNDLMPESIEQGTLFSSSIQIVQPPANVEKEWEMRQEFMSQKFTTSWKEIPSVFV